MAVHRGGVEVGDAGLPAPPGPCRGPRPRRSRRTGCPSALPPNPRTETSSDVRPMRRLSMRILPVRAGSVAQRRAAGKAPSGRAPPGRTARLRAGGRGSPGERTLPARWRGGRPEATLPHGPPCSAAPAARRCAPRPLDPHRLRHRQGAGGRRPPPTAPGVPPRGGGGDPARGRGGRPVPVAGGRPVSRGPGLDDGAGRPRPRRRWAACPAATRWPRGRASSSTSTPWAVPVPRGGRLFYARARPTAEKAVLATGGRARRGRSGCCSIPPRWAPTARSRSATGLPPGTGACVAYAGPAEQLRRGDAPRAWTSTTGQGAARSTSSPAPSTPPPSWTPDGRRLLLHLAADRSGDPRAGAARPRRGPLPPARHRPGRRPVRAARPPATRPPSCTPSCRATAAGCCSSRSTAGPPTTL